MLRHLTVALAATLATTLATTGPPTVAVAHATHPAPEARAAAAAAAVSWQRTAIRTVFTEGASAPPAGALYLAFTSLAVRDAVKTSLAHHRSSETAAIATAAHAVLSEYFPLSQASLDTDLAASLATVPDGIAEARGVRFGKRAAARMIARRVDDGRNDPVTYSLPPGPGVWQPPATGMALPWLGLVDPVLLRRPVALDGPDALDSAEYAADYEEVRQLGRDPASVGQPPNERTATALFFTANPVVAFRNALLSYLDAHPLSLRRTVNLFAVLDAGSADTFIQAWRLKLEIGFWRPVEAIAGGIDDGNPATTPEPGWKPLVPNPAYSDYTSGHAAATSSFAAAVRRTFGNRIALTIAGVGGPPRTYPTLSALERDAFNARIWGGLHFRDAMEDGYKLGHVTVRRIARCLH